MELYTQISTLVPWIGRMVVNTRPLILCKLSMPFY